MHLHDANFLTALLEGETAAALGFATCMYAMLTELSHQGRVKRI